MPSLYSYTLEGLDLAPSQGSASIVVTSLYGPSLGTDGDLELDATGDMRWTDGPEQARLQAELNLDFWLGEYFLDTTQGLPYRRDVLVKNPDKSAIRSVFQRAILRVPGLIEPRVEYTLNTQTRELAITWDARWINGQPLAPVGPKTFIVNIG